MAKNPTNSETPDGPKQDAPAAKPSKKSTPSLSGNVSETIHGNLCYDY